MAALSDAAYLEELRKARDALTAAIVSGRAEEVTIRGRTVRYADPAAALEKINKLIDAELIRTADRSGRVTLGAFGVASHRG